MKKIRLILAFVILVSIISVIVYFQYIYTSSEMNKDPNPRKDSPFIHLEDAIQPVELPDISIVFIDILGNATGQLIIGIINDDGELWSYTLEGSNADTLNSLMIDPDLGEYLWDGEFGLGFTDNGSVAMRVSIEDENRTWILDAWPNTWRESSDNIYIEFTKRQKVPAEELPNSRYVFRWQSVEYANLSYSVVCYSAPEAHGDIDIKRSPCITWKTEDGSWTRPIVIGDWPGPERLLIPSGSSLDDFVILVDRGNLKLYSISDDILIRALEEKT